PIVVSLSAYVLFLVGLNLAGVFEVGESLQGAGGGLANTGGDWGAFFTGVLAVAVAAPCIGPLLTAPIGAAAFLPPVFGMMIFVLMGLGLAAPYLALSFSPALGRYLPKPGAWMTVFKQALAFPVFAAAAYFLWVLAQQAGPTGLARALAGAVLLAMAAWLFQLSKGDGGRAMAVRIGAALAAVFAIAPIVQLKPAEAAASEDGRHGAIASIAFDPAMIPAYRSEGRGVFVDFTAAWCVTCQFNKLTIFSKPSLAAEFAERDVVLMVADWTRRDPEITKALEEFGANGVPLYVYYPPQGAPKVLALPISEKSVNDAISAVGAS
ncbi:MAG: thioredoxin family protein, partial [Pseudomonadota bacterium]